MELQTRICQYINYVPVSTDLATLSSRLEPLAHKTSVALQELNSTAATQARNKKSLALGNQLSKLVIMAYELADSAGIILDDFLSSKIEIALHTNYITEEGCGKVPVGYTVDPESDRYFRYACADALELPLNKIAPAPIVLARHLWRDLQKTIPEGSPDFHSQWKSDIIDGVRACHTLAGRSGSKI